MGDAQERPPSVPVGATDQLGVPTGLSCPKCHGVLWQQDSNGDAFACRVGHRLTLPSLIDDQAHSVQDALWEAVRALDEKAVATQHLADRFGDATAERLRSQSEVARTRADVLRTLLRDLTDDDAGR